MVRSSKLALVAVVGALAFTAGVAASDHADEKVRAAALPRRASRAPRSAPPPRRGG